MKKNDEIKKTRHTGLGQPLDMIGNSSRMHEVAEARQPLCVVNSTRPVLKVSDGIPSTSTNTAAMVPGIQTFYNGTKILRPTGVQFETFSSIYTQLQTDQFAKMVTRCTQIKFLFIPNHTNMLYSTLPNFETFWVYIYKLCLDQFTKKNIVFRVRTLYTIIFENLTQQCMLDRPTIYILVHDTWNIFL